MAGGEPRARRRRRASTRERDEPCRRDGVSAAKAYAGDYLAELVQDCVQLHGGIGVTYEHDLHLYLRRITVDRLTYGTPPTTAAASPPLRDRAA